MGKQDFERAFRGRHGIKDAGYVDYLWEEFGADYDNNRKDKERLEEIWGVIDGEVRSYNFGRARGRTERERDRRTRNERFDEEHVLIEPSGGPHEAARAKAVSEYVAKVASADAVTIRYRERVLGRILTVAEARKFLFSPVAATVPTRIGLRTKPRNVSFLDYEIGKQAKDDSGPYRMLRYSYEGRDIELRLRPLLQVPGRSGDTFLIYPGDTISPEEWWQAIPDQNADVLLLPIPTGDSVVAKTSSALDLLMKQANRLVHRYLLEPTEAAWLILTGEPPEPKYMSATLNSLSTDDLSRAVLTLTVEPWVPPAKVMSYCREIRQSILHDAGSKHRTVEVFRFVVAHTEVEEATLKKTPQWSLLCKLWNDEYPEDHRWHFSESRDFRKAYIRGRDAIVFPLAE
jgi:hypothetical protein